MNETSGSTKWQRLGDGGLHTARYRFTGGVSRTVIVTLSEERFLVYSPGAELWESARDIIPPSAEVLLLAPSAGHTLGIGPWAAAFERSRVVAAEAARARITSKSAVEVDDVERLEATLPEHVRVHVPPSGRIGEVWLSVRRGETAYWLVCDSVMNIAALDERRLVRWLQRLWGLDTGLTVGRVFRLSTRDRPALVEWARARLGRGGHEVLVPCHGEIDEDPRLGERLLELLEDRFGAI